MDALPPKHIASDRPLAEETPEHPDPYEPDELKLLVAEQQLKALAELQEIAMEELRAVRAHAIRERAQGKAVHADLPITRLTKAIRQVMVLQQEICGLRDTQKRELRRLQVARKTAEARRQVKDAVEKAEPGLGRIQLNGRLRKAFADYNDYHDYYRGTVAEIVAQVCKDLGIERDLSMFAEPVMQAPAAENDAAEADAAPATGAAAGDAGEPEPRRPAGQRPASQRAAMGFGPLPMRVPEGAGCGPPGG